MSPLNKKLKHKLGFTLTELLVVISILAILGTIAFISFQGFNKSARDSARTTDLGSIMKVLNIDFATKGKFITPSNPTDITYSGGLVRQQGTFGESVKTAIGNVISKIPLDPKYKTEYTYSITENAKEFQVSSTLEGSQITLNNYNNPLIQEANALGTDKVKSKALVLGNYNQLVVKTKTGSTTYILTIPSIISGDITLNSIEEMISNSGANFVLKTFENAPSSYSSTELSLTGSFSYIPEVVWTETSTTAPYALPSSPSDVLQFIDKVKDAYKETSVGSSSDYNQIINTIDARSRVELGVNVVNNYLGGTIKYNSDTVMPEYTCATPPTITDSNIFTTGNPTTINQEWKYSSDPGSCTFNCKTGYVFDDVNNKCIQDICQGDLTTLNGILFDGSTQSVTQTWKYESVDTDNVCKYTCATGYTYDSGLAACVANNCNAETKLIGLSPDDHSYTVPSSTHGQTQTISSTKNITNGTRIYSQDFTCNLGNYELVGDEINSDNNCNSGYFWNNTNLTCQSLTQTGSCGGSVPTNATAKTPSTFIKNWDMGTSLYLPPTLSWGDNNTTGCDYDCNTGYVVDGSSCIADVCGGTIPANGDSTATSQTVTKSWTYNTTPGACTFVCQTNYTYNSTNNTCVPSTQVVACGGTKPANSTASTAITYTQTWNGSAWSPITSWGESQATCDFNCNTNYTRDGTSCVANTQTSTCTTKPTNSIWNTATSITQTWNGTIWSPTNIGTHNINPSTSSCYFACSPNYTYNSTSNTCVANTKVYTCPTTKPANSVWNTVLNYTQTWNGTAWLPIDTSPIYNTTASTTSCNYKCNTNFHTENSGTSCISNTRSCTITNGTGTQTWLGTTRGTCTVVTCNSGYIEQTNACVADVCGSTIPTNGTSNATGQTITKNWAYNTTAGQCTFICQTNYTYNSTNNTCVANTQTYTCTAKPVNSVWNTVASYLQTWSGTAWSPANTTTTYNTTASTTACNFKCATNYTRVGGVCTASTQSVTCGLTIPTNATATTPTTYTQTWNGGAWTPTTNWGESQSTCDFGCNTGYNWNGTSCVPATCTSPWSTTVNNGASITAWNLSNPTSPTMCTSETRTCNNGVLSGTYTNQSCTQSYRTCTSPWSTTVNNGASITAYSTSTVPYGSTCTSQTRTCNDGTLSNTYTNQSCSVLPAANCTGTAWGTINHTSSVTAYLATSATYPTTCTSQTRTCTNGTLSGTYGATACTQNYTYSRNSGAWGVCSTTCGAGTQTRTVACQRNDGAIVSDTYCTSKPATSQACTVANCSCYFSNWNGVYSNFFCGGNYGAGWFYPSVSMLGHGQSARFPYGQPGCSSQDHFTCINGRIYAGYPWYGTTYYCN